VWARAVAGRNAAAARAFGRAAAPAPRACAWCCATCASKRARCSRGSVSSLNALASSRPVTGPGQRPEGNGGGGWAGPRAWRRVTGQSHRMRTAHTWGPRCNSTSPFPHARWGHASATTAAAAAAQLTRHKQLKALGDALLGAVRLGQRADLNGVLQHKRGLLQR
jgi:hypothetical protein